MSKARTLKVDRDGLCRALEQEAQAIADEDVEMNRAMARFGAALIQDGETILTHCNAGRSPRSTSALHSCHY